MCHLNAFSLKLKGLSLNLMIFYSGPPPLLTTHRCCSSSGRNNHINLLAKIAINATLDRCCLANLFALFLSENEFTEVDGKTTDETPVFAESELVLTTALVTLTAVIGPCGLPGHPVRELQGDRSPRHCPVSLWSPVARILS